MSGMTFNLFPFFTRIICRPIKYCNIPIIKILLQSSKGLKAMTNHKNLNIC